MSVRTCVGVRKLVEAESAMTMKTKVVSLDEETPKIGHKYAKDPSRTQ